MLQMKNLVTVSLQLQDVPVTEHCILRLDKVTYCMRSSECNMSGPVNRIPERVRAEPVDITITIIVSLGHHIIRCVGWCPTTLKTDQLVQFMKHVDEQYCNPHVYIGTHVLKIRRHGVDEVHVEP